jgi:hypothetical protein
MRRESFDEYSLGRWRLQFFEFRHWRLGLKFMRDRGTQSEGDRALVPVNYGWVLVLPFMSVRYHGVPH